MDILQQKINNKPKEIINQDEILCDNKKWTTLTFNNESQIEVYSHIRELPLKLVDKRNNLSYRMKIEKFSGCYVMARDYIKSNGTKKL